MTIDDTKIEFPRGKIRRLEEALRAIITVASKSTNGPIIVSENVVVMAQQALRGHSVSAHPAGISVSDYTFVDADKGSKTGDDGRLPDATYETFEVYQEALHIIAGEYPDVVAGSVKRSNRLRKNIADAAVDGRKVRFNAERGIITFSPRNHELPVCCGENENYNG